MSVKTETQRVRAAVMLHVTRGIDSDSIPEGERVPWVPAGMLRRPDYGGDPNLQPPDQSGTVVVVSFAGVETVQTLDGDAIAETGMCVANVVRDCATDTPQAWTDVYRAVSAITSSITLGETVVVSTVTDPVTGTPVGGQETKVRITSVPKVAAGYTTSPRGNATADFVVPVMVDYWAWTSKGGGG